MLAAPNIPDSGWCQSRHTERGVWSEVQHPIERVMLIFDPGRQGCPIGRRGISAESSLLFGAEMLRTIGSGYDFDVGESRLRPLVKLVMNTSVGNFNFVIDIWQMETLGHFLLDLGDIALRFRFPSSVHCLVDVSLELKIKLNAKILTPSVLDLCRLFEIRAVDLGIVLGFPWLHKPVVELLFRSKLAIRMGQAQALFGQGYHFYPL